MDSHKTETSNGLVQKASYYFKIVLTVMHVQGMKIFIKYCSDPRKYAKSKVTRHQVKTNK